MINMALSALIFDLDGTLVDTTSTHARAWRQTLDEFGYHIPADRIALEIGKGGQFLVPSLIGQQANEKHGDTLRETHTELFLDLIREEGVRVFPKVAELFEALWERDLKIAVATASKAESLETTLEQAGLEALIERVDVVINDSDVEQSKPHPDAVRPAIEKLELSPVQCAFVGDTTYDVEACKHAGLVCLGVTTGPHNEALLRQAGARAVYADIADLLANLDAALALAAPGPVTPTAAWLDTLMDEALEQARTALAQDELPIGCVVARSDSTIVARGFNEARRLKSTLAHAEMQALRQATGTVPGDVRNLVLATTLEPCVMCLGAAMHARVDTIIYGLPAPGNGGIDRCAPLDTPGTYLPRFVGGIRADESRALLAEWLHRHPDDAFINDLLARQDEAATPAD